MSGAVSNKGGVTSKFEKAIVVISFLSNFDKTYLRTGDWEMFKTFLDVFETLGDFRKYACPLPLEIPPCPWNYKSLTAPPLQNFGIFGQANKQCAITCHLCLLSNCWPVVTQPINLLGIPFWKERLVQVYFTQQDCLSTILNQKETGWLLSYFDLTNWLIR